MSYDLTPVTDRTFKGRAAGLTPTDVSATARLIGCDEGVLRAVLSVETDGLGFDNDGRPSVLFEPHLFYRYVPAAQRAEAIRSGLAYPNQGEHPYAPTSAANYQRIVAACALDETAALSSVSWGIGQVLGSNFADCGFASVQEMVAAACDSEGAQLDMVGAFIIRNSLAAALARRDFAAFARGYNGPNYRMNHYDTKLAAYADNYSVSVPQAPAAAPAAPAETADSLNAAELGTLS